MYGNDKFFSVTNLSYVRQREELRLVLLAYLLTKGLLTKKQILILLIFYRFSIDLLFFDVAECFILSRQRVRLYLKRTNGHLHLNADCC